MKARQLLIYVLLIIPALILAGCSEPATTEEQRAILIPPEEGGPIVFVQPRDMPPPQAGQEPPGQVPLPSALQDHSIVASMESRDWISEIIPEGAEIVPLPAPKMESDISLEEALFSDGPTGHYTELPLTVNDISQLLWAAQGIADEEGNRTAPSISSTYPLALYLITGNVTDLKSGTYLYIPAEHELAVIKDGNCIEETGLLPEQTAKSAAYIIVAADFDPTPYIPGKDTKRFIYLEAGRAAQNIHLQAIALGLGTVITVDFTEEQVESAAGIPAYLEMIYIMPVGEQAGL